MSIFGIGAGKEIGVIKTALKEAILDGDVKNEYEAAKEFVIRKGHRIRIKASSINE